MQNFEFYAPTRMIFGKDTHKQVGKLVKEYGFKKVFVHFGGASAKKSGLLDTVLDALKAENIDYVTLGGVQANPTLAMAKEGDRKSTRLNSSHTVTSRMPSSA